MFSISHQMQTQDECEYFCIDEDLTVSLYTNKCLRFVFNIGEKSFSLAYGQVMPP